VAPPASPPQPPPPSPLSPVPSPLPPSSPETLPWNWRWGDRRDAPWQDRRDAVIGDTPAGRQRRSDRDDRRDSRREDFLSRIRRVARLAVGGTGLGYALSQEFPDAFPEQVHDFYMYTLPAALRSAADAAGEAWALVAGAYCDFIAEPTAGQYITMVFPGFVWPSLQSCY